ncbi:MAG: segregation and condensation protein A, partial [Bacillota bacterium]
EFLEPQAPSFKLEVFEGPLDLLLSLIEKNKVDILDIPIALILDQYMEYLDAMRALDMEVAGEFIVCAAELMLIKSRTLLPKSPDSEEEDPRAALAAALIEYKRAKAAAAKLAELYTLHAGRYTREPDMPAPSAEPPLGLDVDLLRIAFNRILEKKRELPRLALRSERTLESLLANRTVPVGERIIWIMRRLYGKRETSFEELLYACRSRSELVATFLALLELLRGQRVTINSDGDELLLTLDMTHGRTPAPAADDTATAEGYEFLYDVGTDALHPTE